TKLRNFAPRPAAPCLPPPSPPSSSSPSWTSSPRAACRSPCSACASPAAGSTPRGCRCSCGASTCARGTSTRWSRGSRGRGRGGWGSRGGRGRRRCCWSPRSRSGSRGWGSPTSRSSTRRCCPSLEPCARSSSTSPGRCSDGNRTHSATSTTSSSWRLWLCKRKPCSTIAVGGPETDSLSSTPWIPPRSAAAANSPRSTSLGGPPKGHRTAPGAPKPAGSSTAARAEDGAWSSSAATGRRSGAFRWSRERVRAVESGRKPVPDSSNHDHDHLAKVILHLVRCLIRIGLLPALTLVAWPAVVTQNEARGPTRSPPKQSPRKSGLTVRPLEWQVPGMRRN
ncbi:hypothetical protein DFJ74DRAFT_457637, partial [Hyaloraphidium curvatum]